MLKKCKVCNGKGHVFVEGFGINVSCDVCHGKGGFDVPENKELCPECNGKGKVTVMTDLGFGIECNCENCFGTGFIDKTTE
ncbi:MAG: hypothetical protein HFJ52_06550 [Clostridia bacterium]|nr:hypothetical protein [Clostridia bacterium]